ncbi:MAG: hypothetical protein HC804_01740 [Anaerolineae bacterium]|nr:hypothetical protein [Anaerolineae bacterium]
MTKFLLPLLFILFLVACAPNEADRATSLTAVAVMGGQGGSLSASTQAAAAQSTAVALWQVATKDASAATAAAYVPTAQAVATANEVMVQRTATGDALAVRATAIHIDATATGYAIMAEGTRQAIGQLATMDARLVADETARLARMRLVEDQNVQRQDLITRLILPVVILVGSFVLFLAYYLYQLQRPVTVPRGDHETFAPPRLVRVTRPHQAAPEMDALTAPVEPLLLPAGKLTGSIMIAAVRGSGKTVALRELVDGRVSNDGPEKVTVLDPHYTDGAWGLARVIGGKGDEVAAYLEWMNGELDRRANQRQSGTRQFPPLTVAMEEMPVLAATFDNLLLNTWRRWVWEGRKFNLNVMIVTQSTRVKSLGIEGQADLLENFNHIVWLGKTAVSEWPEVVQGMTRPAVIKSGHHEPRPLVVPYDPRKDSESESFVPYFVGDSGLVQPTPPHQLPFVAPVPEGVTTQYGYVTPSQVARIVAMHRAGEANSRIETAVFNQSTPGGNAYHKVKKVLEMYG